MRVAPGDKYLTGKNLMGIEIGVDAGAHAEALLHNCAIARLYLVDVWTNLYAMGYAAGRLETKGYKNQVELIRAGSVEASHLFSSDFFDFVYIDQEHDKDAVTTDLILWWPKVKLSGFLIYRNYGGPGGLTEAIDAFVAEQQIETIVEPTEILLCK